MASDKDSLTKAYMERPDVFADAFNFLLYDGEQVIKPEELREMDTTAVALPFGSDGKQASVQKVRDVLKQWVLKRDNDAAYLLLGVENQSDIHYAMPVRNLLYDALQYTAQVDNIAKSHKKSRHNEKATSGEYLSGFHKSDKLIPVITLVIYFGADHWDGPTSLHEMLSVKNSSILKYVADYRINLLTPYALTNENAQKLCTDLKEVMLFVKYSRDKDKLREVIENDKKFRSIARDTARMIEAVTGTDIKAKESGGNVDMCKAIQDIRQEGYEQGIEQGIERGIEQGIERGIEQGIERGIEQGIEQGVEQGVERTIVVMINIFRSMGISDDEIISKIVENSTISVEDAERYVRGS